jgi:hypothetical protein
MGRFYEVKGKSAEDILEEMTNREDYIDGPQFFELQKTAIQVRLATTICNSIDTGSINFFRQIIVLQELIEKARSDFINESYNFRKSMGEVQTSLEKFQKSNEKASKALTIAINILAFVAAVQVLIFAYSFFK